MDNMKESLKKVLIVREGDWGDMHSEKGDYDSLLELLKRIIEQPTKVFNSSSGEFEQKQVAEVEFIETSEEALRKVLEAPINVQIHAVIFKSRSMIDEAKKFKSKCLEMHRGAKIILFSGLLPEEEIILIEHSWNLDHNCVQKIVVSN